MFQSLLYQLKLKFRMINPFDIKQEFKFLNNTQQQCTLHSKEQLNQSTYLMRFAIPQLDKCLGTRIGQYISLNDPKFDINTTRYYCPISRIDDVGMFDLLVHAIYAENKNFSTHITTLNEGHILNINGPFTNYIYHGYGAIELPKNHINQNYQYIGIVAESSAIAAFFQLIEGIATNGDNTHIGLLYVADTLDELVLMEELIWYMEEKKINATFMLRNEKDPINKLFSGPKGQLKPIYLEQYLPQPNDQTLILVCGSRAFKKETKQQLESINHQNIAIIWLYYIKCYIIQFYIKLPRYYQIKSNLICLKYIYIQNINNFSLFNILFLEDLNIRQEMSENIIKKDKVRQYQKVHQLQKEQLQHLVFQKSYSIKSASTLLDINYATAKSIISKIRKSKIRKYFLINKKLRQCQFKKIGFTTPQLEIKSLVSGLLISERIYCLQ